MAEYKVVLLCSKCLSELSEDDNCILCTSCGKKFHYRCLDVEDLQQKLEKVQHSFKCRNCEKSLMVLSTKAAKDVSLAAIPEIPSSSNNASKGLMLRSLSSPSPRKKSEVDPAAYRNVKRKVDTKVRIQNANNVSQNHNIQCPNVSEFVFNAIYNGGNLKIAHSNPLVGSNSREEVGSNSSFIDCLKKKCEAANKTMRMIVCDGNHQLEYSIEHYFVRLRIEERNLLGLQLNEASVDLNRIFYTKCEQGERKKRTILITADPGFGKTTLMKKLCYDWATLINKENYLYDFDFIINIPLKEMGSHTMQTYTLDKIRKGTGDKNLSASILQEWNVLYILDGLDEITQTEEVISFLNGQSNRLQSTSDRGTSTVIVTSRPHAVEKLTSLQRLFDRRLSISGFSDKSKEKYIEKILYDKAKTLKEIMKNNLFLRAVSESPLMLHLICCVHGKDRAPRISSRTELYSQIFKLILEIYAKKHGKNATYRRIHETSITRDKLFIRLGRLAYGYIFEERNITKESLRVLFVENEEFEFVIGSGILEAVETLSDMKPIDVYHFCHVTLAEFLSSIYIADAVRESQLALETKFTELVGMNFLAGVLGEMILNVDAVLSWIETTNFTTSMMVEFQKEADLKTESWKSFRSHIRSISFDFPHTNTGLLRESLPELRELNISCTEVSNKSLWKLTKRFLSRFKSCACLTINVPFEILRHLSSQIEYCFHFINMEGMMSNLIDTSDYMRSRIAESITCIHVLTSGIINSVEMSDQAETLFDKWKTFKDKWKAPFGLLPDVLIRPGTPHEQWFQYTWKIGNIEIRYRLSSEGDGVRRLPIPIVVVSPEEYKKISKNPFLHKPALKVTGFRSSHVTDQIDELNMTFGHVDCSTFLGRLEEDGILPLDENGVITTNDAVSRFDDNRQWCFAESDDITIVEIFRFTHQTNQRNVCDIS